MINKKMIFLTTLLMASSIYAKYGANIEFDRDSIFKFEKFKLKQLPISSKFLSFAHGGTKSEIDSYSDGVGIIIVGPLGEQNANEAVNKLVYKYGNDAKINSQSLADYVLGLASASDQDKIYAQRIKDNMNLSSYYKDGDSCNDGDPLTVNDKYINGVCIGVNFNDLEDLVPLEAKWDACPLGMKYIGNEVCQTIKKYPLYTISNEFYYKDILTRYGNDSNGEPNIYGEYKIELSPDGKKFRTIIKEHVLRAPATIAAEKYYVGQWKALTANGYFTYVRPNITVRNFNRDYRTFLNSTLIGIHPYYAEPFRYYIRTEVFGTGMGTKYYHDPISRHKISDNDWNSDFAWLINGKPEYSNNNMNPLSYTAPLISHRNLPGLQIAYDPRRDIFHAAAVGLKKVNGVYQYPVENSFKFVKTGEMGYGQVPSMARHCDIKYYKTVYKRDNFRMNGKYYYAGYYCQKRSSPLSESTLSDISKYRQLKDYKIDY